MGLKALLTSPMPAASYQIILVSGQIAVTGRQPEYSKFFPKPLEIQHMIPGTSG